MKIEMGESLLYSWLRHVKECQIVQTNWKISSQWELKNRDQINVFLQDSDKVFQEQLHFSIYKSISLEQFLGQAETDVLGISLTDENSCIYAIDVAFHEAGLNYGSREETVSRVVKKCLRTAMCLYGYLNFTEGEIIFASPKIHDAVLNDMLPLIELSNQVLRNSGLKFHVRIIANSDFEEKILLPILVASQGISDTSELFLRSYQMYRMFAADAYVSKTKNKPSLHTKDVRNKSNEAILSEAIQGIGDSGLKEMKVGKIANTVLRNLLEDGRASDGEIEKMQTDTYSKVTFHLNYPLLVKASEPFEKVRYYAKSLWINGTEYFLCSQWFETPANNDKPDLLKWIVLHNKDKI